MARDFDARAKERGSAGFLQGLALQEEDKDEEDERPAVSLFTIHAAKGLEFEHVFIAGVEEGILPHKKSVPGEDEDDEAAARMPVSRRSAGSSTSRSRARSAGCRSVMRRRACGAARRCRRRRRGSCGDGDAKASSCRTAAARSPRRPSSGSARCRSSPPAFPQGEGGGKMKTADAV